MYFFRLYVQFSQLLPPGHKERIELHKEVTDADRLPVCSVSGEITFSLPSSLLAELTGVPPCSGSPDSHAYSRGHSRDLSPCTGQGCYSFAPVPSPKVASGSGAAADPVCLSPLLLARSAVFFLHTLTLPSAHLLCLSSLFSLNTGPPA